MKSSTSEFITVRGLRYHLRHWGRQGAPQIVMLHGWMDVSASFQFMVDCLKQDWHVVAPDWRGFGLSDPAPGDCYWFPDYLGDLDAILQQVSPGGPVNLLGHSMGGNVAGIYAGVRQSRIRRLVSLEGFGLADADAGQAPGRYAQWLDELQRPPAATRYGAAQDVVARLQKNNPRLTDARAAFLASHWAFQDSGGQWEIRGDAAHKMVNPYLYRSDEVTACWRNILAPTLWIDARDTHLWRWLGSGADMQAEIERRFGCIAHGRRATVEDAGHMLHHDQPETVASLVEDFLL